MTTRKSAEIETQYAIYALINTNSHIITTHSCPVYDYVPESVTAGSEPYIEISDPTEIPWADTFLDGFGQRLTFRLHIWSTYRGKKECAEIIGHLKELLDTTCSGTGALTITGYTHVKTVSEFSTIMRDPDKIHYHGVLDLGVYVRQT